MVAADLKKMDVDALLALRADVERALAERARDLERQLALVGGAPRKKRGRPAGGAMRASTLKGSKVAPKYRGPGGETWAGRGAQPRWLTALLKEGHSLEEFSVAPEGGKITRGAVKKRDVKAKRKPVARKKG
jgi:DNA-binding protein H-NS